MLFVILIQIEGHKFTSFCNYSVLPSLNKVYYYYSYVTRDMCFPGGGTHFTRDTCFPGGGMHISTDMYSYAGEHISLGICVSKVGNTYH